MYCPECGAEFREEIDRCADCDVPLTEKKPSEDDSHEAEDLVTVLETSEVDALPVVKTALESAGIPVYTTGEDLMSLFPSEAMGAALHASGGEVKVQVPASRAEEARALLTLTAEVDDAERRSHDGSD